MYTASDLKKGLRIKIDNDPYILTEFNFVKPGKGQALYRCKLKKMQYLYKEEDKYCFMDNETFEQIYLTEEQMEDAKNFLIDNIEAEILLFDDRAIGISLPNFVDLVVTEAEPWAKGDTVSGATKPVKLQTGYIIQVPTFVNEGEKIRVDTRTGEYMTRVKG